MNAGRRWGKSVLSELVTLKWALESRGLYWIVSPTYRQSKQIHWNQMNHLVAELKLEIEKKNEVELSLTLKNGSIIELKGAENPDALRGVKLRGLIIDEIASIRNWDWLWSEVLRPTLTDYQAPALFISTPKGFNHFYTLFNMGQHTEGDYKSWRFTSYDNPYISKQEIDLASKELTEDTFHQEYLADFRKFTGLVHKYWDRKIHLIQPFLVPNSWQRGRGFDYGSAHYTGSVRHAIDNDDNWFLERCYLDNRRDIKGHAEAILTQDYGLGLVISYGDPSGNQWEYEFNDYGINIQPAQKETNQNFKTWIEFCVEKVNERLKPIIGHTVYLPDGRRIDNAPKLFVLDTLENQSFVKQIETLKWRETVTGDIQNVLDESGDPTGGHYDLMAAERYFAVSFSKQMDNYKKPDYSGYKFD